MQSQKFQDLFLLPVSITFTVGWQSTFARQFSAHCFVDVIRSIRKMRLNKKPIKKLFSYSNRALKHFNDRVFLFLLRPLKEKLKRSKKTTRATRNWVHLLHACADESRNKKNNNKFPQSCGVWIKRNKITRIARHLITHIDTRTLRVMEFATTLICIVS